LLLALSSNPRSELNDDYPLVAYWAWLVYTAAFPAIVVAGTVALLRDEWLSSPTISVHQWFDSLAGVAVVITFALYKFLPLLAVGRQRVCALCKKDRTPS